MWILKEWLEDLRWERWVDPTRQFVLSVHNNVAGYEVHPVGRV